MKLQKQKRVHNTLDADGEMDTMFTEDKARAILGDKKFEELEKKMAKERRKRN